MKANYIVKVSEKPTRIGIADLGEFTEADLDVTWYPRRGQLITRIQVPQQFRGLGYGRELLRQILEDADREKVHLWLYVRQYIDSPLDDGELMEWYGRNGFEPLMDLTVAGWMHRRPQ